MSLPFNHKWIMGMFVFSALVLFDKGFAKGRYLGKYLIKFKNSGDIATQMVSNLKWAKGVKVEKNFKAFPFFKQVSLHYQGLMSLAEVGDMIEFIEYDHVIKLNNYVDRRQWGLDSPRGFDVGALDAWKVTKGDPKVVVAVVDSGIDYNHQSLNKSMWKNPQEIPSNGKDDDGNGFIDDVYGWDFANADNDPSDEVGHGTHCAGIIAAQGTIQGIAPQVKIMALKFITDDGTGTLSAAISSIDYAINNGAKVISNSWGSGLYSNSLKYIIKKAHEKGILFVAAAGNSAMNNDTDPMYPASYEVRNVVSVAAINRYGSLASFSNYGRKSVHLAAPGEDILSTYPGQGYEYLDGTSMATPFVSGIAALLYSMNPQAKVETVKNTLMASVKKVEGLRTLSGGTVSAAAAVKKMQNLNPPPPPAPEPDPVPTPEPEPDPLPPPPPSFDMDQVKVVYSEYRPWYSSYYRYKLKIRAPAKVFNKIKKVVWELDNSNLGARSSTSRSKKFEFKFKSKRTYFKVWFKVITKMGQEYTKGVIVDH